MLQQTVFLRDGNSAVTLTCMTTMASPYMPNKNKRPALLIFPGGGYEGCSPREGEPIARTFLGLGYNCFILHYSINEAAKYPSPLEDAIMAMRHIRQYAQTYNVDPQKIGVIGFSAGAHLAGMLGVAWDAQEASVAAEKTYVSARPDALILCYGVLCADEFTHEPSICLAAGSSVPTQKERDSLSVVKRVRSDMPPCFVFHTADDEMVPVENALEMASSLRRHNVSFELHVFYKGPHGIALASSETSCGYHQYDDAHVAQWVPLAHEWLGAQYESHAQTTAHQ
ncbi:MAG TPA: alpha/beta hydrolase [Clostridia bacterium]|nr:alpha/beta hydrolase [Clostridia bacterium]